MTESTIVRAEPISAEAFAPYGQVVTAQAANPDGRDVSLTVVQDVDFSGGPTIIRALTFRWRAFSFTHLEQHGSFTQAFLPADGKPALVVVAMPVGAVGSDPDLDTLKAFVLDGTQGILLNKGTWHFAPFPLTPLATYTMIGCADTPKESEGYLDMAARTGKPFQIVL
jgi:ureidoglycolate lyase